MPAAGNQTAIFSFFDAVLIAFLLVLSISIWVVNGPETVSRDWEILVLDHPERRLIVQGDHQQSIVVEGTNGEVVIETDGNGRFRFLRSSCPNQICVRTGWLKAPMSVPCIPNKVMLGPARKDPYLDGITR